MIFSDRADVVCTDQNEMISSLIELNMKVNEPHVKEKFDYCELKW